MDPLVFIITSLPILVSFFIFFFKQTRSANQKLPPGPWKLPMIGNMHNLIGSVPHRTLHKLSMKFGPVMHLQIGQLSTVIISSPEAAKQVMKTHDINFASRPSILVPEIISYNCTNISFSPYGDYWRQLRKICTLELLSTKRVSSFRSIREEACSDLATWLQLAASSDEGSRLHVINLTEKLYSSAYALVSRAAVGKKTEVKERLLPVIQEAIRLAAGFNVANAYPSVKFLQMMSGLKSRVKKLHRVSDKILDEIIHEHRAYSVNPDEKDLVDVLLGFQNDGLEIPLTDQNIKAVVLDMLGAGSETSATIIDWAMAEMLRNPIVLEKAQDEVRRVFDDKLLGYVDESKIHELKYLKSIIKETLRFHPPVPILLPRKCMRKCKIDGYEIPVDTKIMVNAWAINRDPKYWEDADCFEPERFLDSLVDYKGNHFEYIPFGAGRRMCPGISFGLANVELPLAMFLYHFDWSLPDGMKHEELDMTERSGVTARRNDDLLVIPVIKRPFLLPHVT